MAIELTDASNYPGFADQTFSPENEVELAALLKRATAEKIPVTVSGAWTGLAGGGSDRGLSGARPALPVAGLGLRGAWLASGAALLAGEQA